MSVATSTAVAIGVAAGTAGGSAIAAHETGKAAEKGAALTSSAANYAADTQSKSAAASLAFEQQKDREAQAQAAATQKANYDQWAARETRMNDIRASLGMPAHPIPDYVPTTTAGTPGATTPPPPGTSPPPPGTTTPGGTGTPPATSPTQTLAMLSNPSAWMSLVGNDPALKSWVTAGLGSGANTPGLVDYYVGKIKGQPGANPTEQAGSANYWLQKLQNDPNVRGGAAAAPGPANTLASFLPTGTASLAPRPVTQLPYMNPNGNIYNPTIGSYAPQQ